MTTLARLFSSAASPGSQLLTLELPGLRLPTGRLVACDPLADLNPQPFTRACPSGRYSVFLHLLPTEARIAYAELRLSPAPTNRCRARNVCGYKPFVASALVGFHLLPNATFFIF